MIAGPGAVLADRYKLEQILGQGGMGTVFRARHTRLNKAVAVKALLARDVDPARYPEHVAQFENEAQILASLDHPGLVTVSDFFEQDGVHYLVMELLEGKTLTDVAALAPKPLSERRVLQWANEILDVLAYLHSRQPPIVVKDLKPDNIMLLSDGRLKLIDFGIAKRLSPDGGTMDIAKGVGTEEYAPLEQYGRGSTDQRSDIYSLGATLYFLLTKQPPTPAWKRATHGESLPDPRQWNPSVTETMAAALKKLTGLFPQDRPASVEEARKLLPQPTSTTTTTAAPIPSGTYGMNASTVPQGRHEVHGGGKSRPLAVQLKASATVLSAPSRGEPPPLAWLHGQTALIVGGDGARLYEPGTNKSPVQLVRGVAVSAVSISSDDRHLAVGAEDGSLSMHAANHGTLKLQLSKGAWLRSDRVRATRFFSGGQMLLALSEGQQLGSYALKYGRKALSFRPPTSWLSLLGFDLLCADVSPAGLVAAGASDGSLCTWDASTAREGWQKRHDQMVRAVAFSPDGVFLASTSADRTLRIWRSNNGQQVAKLQVNDLLTDVSWSGDGKLLAVGTTVGVVHLVELTAARSLSQIRGSGTVAALAFHPRERDLAVSWGDGTVKAYQLGW